MFHTLAQLKNRVAETAVEREQAVRFEIERRTMAGSDRVVAATEIDRTQILRHYGQPAPIEVIPGGVDLDLFTPRPGHSSATTAGARADEKVLLFVGPHPAAEGVGDPAAGAAALSDLNARVVVVGGQPSTSHEAREITRLRDLSTRLGIQDRVTFTGAVPHERLPTFYSAADVTVMPSSYESFGLVAVESLACGTPVVATRVGGLTAIIKDGETGLLVPWRDPACSRSASDGPFR